MKNRARANLLALSIVLCLFAGCLTALAVGSAAKAEKNEPFAALSVELEQHQSEFSNPEKAVSFVRDWFRKRNIEVEVVSRTSKDRSRSVLLIGIRHAGTLGLPTFRRQAVLWWGTDGKVRLDQLELDFDT